MRRTKVALLAGGMGVRMQRLGHNRLKPLIPFGGSCHLIDFSIDNACRSGAAEVLLMAQYNEQQLIGYLLDSWCRRPGFRIHFGPYQGVGADNIAATFGAVRRPQERGTADALIKNGAYLFTPDCELVMVLHADHVYRFDYQPMVDFHRASGAALTIGYQKIDLEYVKLFGMVEFDARQNLRRFVEKPPAPTSDTVFTAVCIFDAAVLQRYLGELEGSDWQYDISRDLIPAMLANGEPIKGFAFPDYWEDIGTVERYYLANMRLLGATPSMPRAGLPLTLCPQLARRHIGAEGKLRNVLAAADLDTRASIENAIIYPGARIAHNATVRNSIVLPGAIVGDAMLLENAILLAPDPGCDPGPLDLIQLEPPQ
jgi:ADP-glucose pyrophosphorylase